MVKKIICDLDNTLTLHGSASDYAEKLPNKILIEKLVNYKNSGYEIVIFTARNMNTFKGNVDKINEFTLPIIVEWLEKHGVPFNEIIVGKPWCDEGFYLDDRAIRPKEFIELCEEELLELVK